jgi:hypothetical protein
MLYAWFMKTIYEQLGEDLGKLVAEKNAAYGSSFAESHKILSVLYPNGIQPEQYTDALAVIRVIDKLFRIATAKDAFGESPWRDIAGYGILGAAKNETNNVSIEQHSKMDKPVKKVAKRR